MRERKLGHWAIAYAAAAWALLQVLDLLAEHFAWPSVVLRVVIVLVLAGFLLTLVLVWYHGEQGRQSVSGPELILIAALLGVGGLALMLVTREENAGTAAEGGRVADVELDPQRVAVLPLRNASPGDPESEMLAAGVHDDLLTRLTRIADLTVVSRTSVMEYAATTKNIRTIAAELAAGAILEGSVQLAGANVRVNMQLIDGRDDRHLWAETYTRPWSLDNLFAIQTEIAEAVAIALSATLNADERASIATRPTESEEAYARYVEMRALWSYQTEEGLRSLLELGGQALRQDPEFVEVHALVSLAHSFSFWLRSDRSPERLRLAKTAADAGLAIDPDHPDALTALGYYHYWGFLEYERASALFRRVLERIPRHDQALSGIASVLRRQGRMEEALDYFRQANEVDPRSIAGTRAVAETFDMLRRCDEADSTYRHLNRLGAFSWENRLSRADHYLACGRMSDAREQANLAAASNPDGHPIGMAAQVDLYARQPRQALSRLASAPNDVTVDRQMRYRPRALLYGDAYRQLGIRDSASARYREAALHLERLVARTPQDERAWSALGLAYAGLGRKDDALRAARRGVELLPIEREAWRGAYRLEELARTYARVGEVELALEVVERLMSLPLGLVLSRYHLQLDPEWDVLRGSPRFQRLLSD